MANPDKVRSIVEKFPADSLRRALSSRVRESVQVPYAPDYLGENLRLNRQRYAESAFNDRAKSPAGATGAYQIMPITQKDYLSRGKGVAGDLLDPNYNRQVRDFALDIVPRDLGDTWSDNDSEEVRLAKRYAGYNWGAGSLKRYLRKQRNAGVDISNSLDWMSGLPKETKDYVDFIVLGNDVPGTSKTMDAYRKAWGRYSTEPFPEDSVPAVQRDWTFAEGGLLLRDYRNGGKIKTDNTGKSWWQNTLNYFVGGERGLLESLYRPTRGDVGERYYTRDGLKNDVVLNLLGGSKAEERTDLGSKKYYSDFNEAYDSLSALNRTGISGSRNAGNATLGTYGVSAGSDDRGRYISFADKYDYRVLPMILPKLLHPFHIYDRIYEDEWDNIASQVSQSDPEAGNFWLAPQVQTGDTGIYKSGGKIHIKPENRGKFTALKKRTGHSASWFKAHGTPAQKKMAVFALNARKWKHGDGGLIERMQSVYGDDIAAMREAIQLAKSKK